MGGCKELETEHSRHSPMGIALINCLLMDKTLSLESDVGSVISLLCGFRKKTISLCLSLYSVIYSFSQLFIEHRLCSKDCSRHSHTVLNKINTVPALRELTFSWKKWIKQEIKNKVLTSGQCCERKRVL